MNRRRVAMRAVIGLAVLGFPLVLMTGIECPAPVGTTDPLGGTDGPGPGDGSDGTTSKLVASAGPDAPATVGFRHWADGSASGGVGALDIGWSAEGPGGVPVALIGPNSLSPSFTPSQAGVYTLTLTVTDASGVEVKDYAVVRAGTEPALAALTWDADYNGGGYQVLARFTVDLVGQTAESPANYRLAGGDITPTRATLGPDERTVTLLFDEQTLSTDTALALSVGDSLVDTHGNTVPQITNKAITANDKDVDDPDVAGIQWGVDYAGSYRVEVEFDEAMDAESAENPDAYRAAEGNLTVFAVSAELEEDGRTVLLIFDGLALSSPGTELDLGLQPILDINGNRFNDGESALGEAIDQNPADTRAPEIATYIDAVDQTRDAIHFAPGSDGNGYEVTIEFDEAMDKSSAGTASAYEINGTDAAEATLGPDGLTVTLAFDGTASLDSKLSIDGGTVRDVNGETLAAQTDLDIQPATGTTGTADAPTLTWFAGDVSTGYQIWATFPVAMDATSVETVDHWRIAGTDIHPSSVALSTTTNATTGAIASRTAELTFDTFDPDYRGMRRSDRIDVSIDDSIVDINGKVVPETTLPINANPADTVSPSLVADFPQWTGGATSYEIIVEFDETMDAASARNAENYRLAGNRPMAPADAAPDTPAVTIDETGRIVTLTFGQLSGGAISAGEGLSIANAVRDVNGRAFLGLDPIAIETDDGTGPDIDSITWGVNPSPYHQVVVEFDEAVDQASAERPEVWELEGVEAVDAVLDPTRPTRLILSFPGPDPGFDPNAELTLKAGEEIEDVSGNGSDAGDLGLPDSPDDDDEDEDGPGLIAVVWQSGSDTGYRVIATFSEAVAATEASDPGNYALAEVEAKEATLLSSTSVEVLFSYDEADPPPGNAVAFDRLAQLVAEDIEDMHGNAGDGKLTVSPNESDLSNPGPALLACPLVWEENYDAGGYKLFLHFDEVMDRVTAETPANYQIAGTTGKPLAAAPDSAVLAVSDEGLADGDIGNDRYAGRTVVLTFEADDLPRGLASSDALEISMGDSILDVNGRPAISTDIQYISVCSNDLDIKGPDFAADPVWAVDGETYMLTLTFDEAMDWFAISLPVAYVIGPNLDSPTTGALEPDGVTATIDFVTTTEGLAITDMLAVGVWDINLQGFSGGPVRPVANPGDTSGPEVDSQVWGVDQAQYQVLLGFNEVLDRTSAIKATSYELTGTETLTPTGAVLQPDGRTVALDFAPTTDGLAAESESIEVIAVTVKDINDQDTLGLPPTIVEPNPDDITPPAVELVEVVGVNGVDTTLVDVRLTFNEVLDRTSAETLTHYLLDPTNLALEPTVADLEADGLTVVLGFQTGGDPADPADVNGLMVGVSVDDNLLDDIPGTVKDINGVVMPEEDLGPLVAP